MIGDSSRPYIYIYIYITLTRREIFAVLYNLFSFARCAGAMASVCVISTSDVRPNPFIQSVANKSFFTIMQRLSIIILVSLMQ